jgi:hypothetical protein
MYEFPTKIAFVVSTPIIVFPSQSIFFTLVCVWTSTPNFSSSCFNKLVTSVAFSVFGKARLPACTTNGIPRDSKKSNVSCTENCENGEWRYGAASPYIKRSFFVSNSAFVILHRPPPVISNFRPRFLFFSNITTDFPDCAAEMAAIIPDAPPPITTTSNCSD